MARELSTIGPFQILRQIGHGGMGAVYEARHPGIQGSVALKVILDASEEDSELKERFNLEIETLQKLRHNNIARLYGFGDEDGYRYYAMEFVDGPSLQDILKKRIRFTWEQVAHIGYLVAGALHHAHIRGIIHRDIKPANILLPANGQAKVTDFGIAHFFSNSRMTGENMVIGTIEFMAPEQASAGPISPKSDIYSLGALMYTLLAAAPPYIARSLPEILKKYRQGPPESVRFKRPDVPTKMDLLLMDLLRVDPGQRPKNAYLVQMRLKEIWPQLGEPDINPFQDFDFGLEQKPPVETPRSPSRLDLTAPSAMMSGRSAVSSSATIQSSGNALPNSGRGVSSEFVLSDEIPREGGAHDESDFELGTGGTVQSGPDSVQATQASALAETIVTDAFDDLNTLPQNVPDASATPDAVPAADPNNTIPLSSGADQTGRLIPEEESSNLDRTVALPGSENRTRSLGSNLNEGWETGARRASTSDQLGRSATFATGTSSTKTSHFTMVLDKDLDTLHRESSEQAVSMTVWVFSIILLVVGVIFWQLLRNPSADKLYGKITEKIEAASTDTEYIGALRTSEDRMQQFITLYPNDGRAQKVRKYINDLELGNLERRLERQLDRKSRDDSLTAIEYAYVEAIQAVKNDPDRGVQKLEAFIRLFSAENRITQGEDADGGADQKDAGRSQISGFEQTVTGQCVQLAERRLEKIREELTIRRQQGIELLRSRLEWVHTLEETDPQRAQTIRDALVLFYGSKPWAEEILREDSSGETAETQPGEPARGAEEENAPAEDNPPEEPAEEGSPAPEAFFTPSGERPSPAEPHLT